jgi:tetratricopeptide (TPR) repeat protein
MDARYRRIAYLLVGHAGWLEWPWLTELGGKPADMKRANKFLLALILNHQMNPKRVWRNARKFAEEELGDPERLWHTIAERFPDADAFAEDEQHKWLHKLSQGRKRVVRIAHEMVRLYGGDARSIWQGRRPAEVLARLGKIRAGKHISRLTVGALIDTGQIPREAADLPGDSHVKRVLGRCILGREADAGEAVALARQLHPENPWALNDWVYTISLEWCRSQDPDCGNCRLALDCAFGGRVLTHTERVDECLGWAGCFWDEGRPDAVLEFASYAVELAPQDARAYCWRGAGNLGLGESEETHADLAEALRLDPKLGIAYAVRALAFSRQGEHKSAEADATKYVALAPDAADSYDVRGGIRQAMGKHAEAVKDFTRAMEMAQDEALAGLHLERGVSLAALGKHGEAVDDFTRGMELVRHNVPAQWYRERAASLKALGKEREARQDEKKAEKLEAEEAQEA